MIKADYYKISPGRLFVNCTISGFSKKEDTLVLGFVNHIYALWQPLGHRDAVEVCELVILLYVGLTCP